jgi:hypothetical protein
MCSIGTCIAPPFCCIASDAVQANIASASVIATVAKEHVKERLSNIRIKRWRYYLHCHASIFT